MVGVVVVEREVGGEGEKRRMIRGVLGWHVDKYLTSGNGFEIKRDYAFFKM